MLLDQQVYGLLGMDTRRTEVSVLGRERVSFPLGFLMYCLLTEIVLFWMSRSSQRRAINSPFRRPLTEHGEYSMFRTHKPYK